MFLIICMFFSMLVICLKAVLWWCLYFSTPIKWQTFNSLFQEQGKFTLPLKCYIGNSCRWAFITFGRQITNCIKWFRELNLHKYTCLPNDKYIYSMCYSLCDAYLYRDPGGNHEYLNAMKQNIELCTVFYRRWRSKAISLKQCLLLQNNEK